MHEREQVPIPAVHDDTTPRAVALGLQPVLNSRDGVRDGTNRVQRLLTERDHQFGARVDELGSQGRSPRFRTGEPHHCAHAGPVRQRSGVGTDPGRQWLEPVEDRLRLATLPGFHEEPGDRSDLDDQIDRLMIPFVETRDRLDTIPGIGKRNAEIIVAEIGIDMTQFPTPAHLASWAGLCPGNNESAGKHKSTATRSGNPWLTSALVEAAWSAVRTKDCYLAVRFRRIAKRRGDQRALIAIAHTILVICWHLLVDQTTYTELGTDYLAGKDQPDRRRKQLVAQLEQLGYNVDLTHAA